jgi:hypothetical protein
MSKILKSFAAASIFVLATTATGALAVPLSLENVAFTWSDPVNGNNIEYSGQGTDDAQIRWGGSGATFTEKSGYEIQATSDPVPDPGVGVDDPFILATFTHFNEPITAGTAIGFVNLLIGADVYDNGTFVKSVSFEFQFEHLETSNSGPCDETTNPVGTVCDDRVTVSLINVSDTFNSNGVEYTLEIEGFLQGGDPTNVFYSGEGGTNSAQVQAVFAAAQVPLPAAGWLLIAGIGGLAAIRRKKKAA